MAKRLVIVPRGSAKVWDKHATAGPTAASDTYTGGPFKMNRQYAECFGDAWVILSAEYGFLRPDDLVEGPYNVTFNKPATQPVAVAVLRDQVRRLCLDHFDEVVGLGGDKYRQAIRGAFADGTVELRFPFAGLPIGKMLQATKKAIEAADSRGRG